MRSFLLNKLVRDNIPDEMRREGQDPVVRTLSDDEFKHELLEKLGEELDELKASKPEDVVKELADVLEVVEALAGAHDIKLEDLRKVQAERKAARGGFQKRLYIERLDLADDDRWVEYYAAEPDRFPEVKE